MRLFNTEALDDGPFGFGIGIGDRLPTRLGQAPKEGDVSSLGFTIVKV